MIAAEAVDRRIDAAYLAASAAAVDYVRVQAARVLDQLGFWSVESRGRSPDDLAALLGVVPAAAPAFSWLLAEATAAGWSSAPGDTELARAARRLADHAAIVGSSQALLAYVAERYPSVLRGQRSGLAVLLKGEGLTLWESYFSAANPLYDVHNQLAAEGLRAVWRHLGPGPRILELGTGTGGATAALLRVLDEQPDGADAELVISDRGPSFLVRAAERYRPLRPSLRSLKIDFDRGLDEQGIPPGSVHVVIATNALHAARDLGATLNLVRPALAPDGFLVVSESVCATGHSVHQEFVFNVLGGLETSTARSRFLSSDRWERVLGKSGLTSRVLVNRTGPELAMLAVASTRPRAIFTSAPEGA